MANGDVELTAEQHSVDPVQLERRLTTLESELRAEKYIRQMKAEFNDKALLLAKETVAEALKIRNEETQEHLKALNNAELRAVEVRREADARLQELRTTMVPLSTWEPFVGSYIEYRKQQEIAASRKAGQMAILVGVAGLGSGLVVAVIGLAARAIG